MTLEIKQIMNVIYIVNVLNGRRNNDHILISLYNVLLCHQTLKTILNTNVWKSVIRIWFILLLFIVSFYLEELDHVDVATFNTKTSFAEDL